MEQINITIKTPFIKLEQLLKLAGLTDTGGFAKQIIQDGAVCTMRGKKIRGGDTVTVENYQVNVTAPEEDA